MMEFKGNQKDVINFGKGNLLVEAGPGSGKTTVIVERIRHLIEDEDVDPESFLVITFTVKAAENLQSKLREILSKEITDKMQISTIHSFCIEFLKSRNHKFELIDDDNSEKKILFIQKHRKYLGFKGVHALKAFQIPAVVDKFEEYTNFSVDDEGLISYIKDNEPIRPEFYEFVKENPYFSNRQAKDAGFKDDWYNARFLQTAKSYRKFLDISFREAIADFNTVQYRALEELKKDPETPYKTILIDEFQDTDPLQFEIFKVLLENCDYFTAVGDIDQRIYSFRSAFNDYFDEMESNYDVERISLNINFRSTEDIVNVTDSFIRHQRSKKSKKHLEANNEEYNNDSFIVMNDDYDNEADKIFDIITALKEDGKINDYCDVAVLYRKHGTDTITRLMKHFISNDIPFSIKGQSDLKDRKEIKAMRILLWYITRRLDDYYLSSQDEYNWLNLSAFCDDELQNTFWCLEDETKEYLLELEDSFESEVTRVRNIVSPPKTKRPKNFTGTYGESEENLIKIFAQVEKPKIDLSRISNENDRVFFERLEEVRSKVHLEEPTILEIYYKLLTLGNYLDDIDEYNDQCHNLAALTQTMYNYENMISKTNINGLIFFLDMVLGKYDAHYSTEEGVQLMTVHSAKGLEFPVTIVASLEKDEFPMKVKDPKRRRRNIFRKDTFYTPNEFLKYKKGMTIDEENEHDTAEEERVVYVAMTRAADLLILSCVGTVPEQIERIMPNLKELDLSDVIIKNRFTPPEEEKLRLNYSSYSTYKLCPHMYNLIYNFGFRISDEDVTNLGSVYHEIMEEINLKFKEGETLSPEELDEITKDIYESWFDIEDTEEDYEKLKRSIRDYYVNYSQKFDVVDSELSFEIERENYILNGAIDLIYRIDDENIGILDYKNTTADENKIKKYSEQLYVYAFALRELEDFKDLNIKEAQIHFVQSDEKPKFNLCDEQIDNQLQKLNEAAEKIINEEYPKKKSNFCDYCKFNIICQGE